MVLSSPFHVAVRTACRSINENKWVEIFCERRTHGVDNDLTVEAEQADQTLEFKCPSLCLASFIDLLHCQNLPKVSVCALKPVTWV